MHSISNKKNILGSFRFFSLLFFVSLFIGSLSCTPLFENFFTTSPIITTVHAQEGDSSLPDKIPPQVAPETGEPGALQKAFIGAINFFLEGIFSFFGFGVTAASILFTYTIDARNYTLLNSEAVKDSWRVVRDLLNLAFILVLLFSAFATIFQVEKYHLKKVVLTLIIMALLVNFSFPISRFVIDSANIPMYYMVQTIFQGGGAGPAAAVSDATRINELIKPQGDLANPVEWIAAIVFLFIFMITMFALAIMFLIRLAVLIMLVIFSPIGFAAAIFPSTKNYADDYWQALFKNAFFGPIMVLVLAICLAIIQAFQASEILSIAKNNVSSGSQANMMATWAFYFIPIVMLWGGMIWAQKLGAVGASIVMSKANDLSKKSWGGIKPALWVGTGGPLGNSFRDRVKSIPLGFKKAYYDDPKKRSKDRQEDYSKQVAGFLPGSGSTLRGAMLSVQNQRVSRLVKEMEEDHVDPNTALQQMQSNDQVKSVAAAQYMAKKDYLQTPQTLTQAVKAAQGDATTLKEISKNLSDSAISGLDPKQTQQLFTDITDISSKQRFQGLQNQPEIVNTQIANLRRTFEKEFREKGRLHQLIEMDIQANIDEFTQKNNGQAPDKQHEQKIRDDAYNPNNSNSRLNGRSLSELAKQDAHLFDAQKIQTQSFYNYLSNIRNTDSRAYQNFYGDLSVQKRTYAPEPQNRTQNQQPQPKQTTQPNFGNQQITSPQGNPVTSPQGNPGGAPPSGQQTNP